VVPNRGNRLVPKQGNSAPNELIDAKILIEDFRRKFNEARPQSALGIVSGSVKFVEIGRFENHLSNEESPAI
jgi:hypothetical protein